MSLLRVEKTDAGHGLLRAVRGVSLEVADAAVIDTYSCGGRGAA